MKKLLFAETFNDLANMENVNPSSLEDFNIDDEEAATKQLLDFMKYRILIKENAGTAQHINSAIKNGMRNIAAVRKNKRRLL